MTIVFQDINYFVGLEDDGKYLVFKKKDGEVLGRFCTLGESKQKVRDKRRKL